MDTGRPTDFTKEIGDKICLLIATSNKGLRKICIENEDLPCYATVFNWLKNPTFKEFLDLYELSKREQAEFLADEILDIADDSTDDFIINVDGSKSVRKDHIQRSRLRVDSRKWLASKLLPKKYGDKLDVTSGGQAISLPSAIANASLQELKAMLNEEKKDDEKNS